MVLLLFLFLSLFWRLATYVSLGQNTPQKGEAKAKERGRGRTIIFAAITFECSLNDLWGKHFAEWSHLGIEKFRNIWNSVWKNYLESINWYIKRFKWAGSIEKYLLCTYIVYIDTILIWKTKRLSSSITRDSIILSLSLGFFDLSRVFCFAFGFIYVKFSAWLIRFPFFIRFAAWSHSRIFCRLCWRESKQTLCVIINGLCIQVFRWQVISNIWK